MTTKKEESMSLFDEKELARLFDVYHSTNGIAVVDKYRDIQDFINSAVRKSGNEILDKVSKKLCGCGSKFCKHIEAIKAIEAERKRLGE